MNSKLPNKSKYHLFIIPIYIIISIYYLFFNSSARYNYIFNNNDFRLILPVVIFALATLLIINNFLKFGKIGINKKNLSKLPLIIFYALILIAIPEEIIFRGIIQTYFQNLTSIIAAIFLSSLVYGIAHILNGAKGLTPKKWNWKLVIMTFALGIYIGFTYFTTNSLIIPTIIHTIFIIILKIFVK